MKWSDLVGQKKARAIEAQANEHDLWLFQFYLCRLYCESGLTMLLDREDVIAYAENVGAQLGDLPEERSITRKQEANFLRSAMRTRAAELESLMTGDVKLSFEPLLMFLAERLHLGGAEIKILTLYILKTVFPWGSTMLDELGTRGSDSVAIRALANALSESMEDVLNAVVFDSKLEVTQLACRSISAQDLDDYLMPGKLLSRLVLESCQGVEDKGVYELVFAHLFPVSQPAMYALNAFSGFTDLQLLLDYLSKGMEKGKRGKNVLIYGPPGTGKTQLSRTLAQHMGLNLYEVPTHTKDTSPKTGRARLNAARVAQDLLEEKPGSLLLFDEMEDAFRVSEEFAKGWFNQLLETNPVPTIWISNDIGQVDPAILRRFGLIVPLGGLKASPNGSVSMRLEKLPVSTTWIKALQSQPWMTPALAENLSDIGSLLPAGQVLRNQKKLESVLVKRLSALCKEPVSLTILEEEHRSEFPAFRNEWLSTFPDIRNVERGLQVKPSARLCLFGPPGAGKTAYASELARRLGRPFEFVSGSDLMSCMVGETEQNIAAMFQRAESAGAVLLLDEADTILFSRETARQSWEVSMTNELMIRMERFNGVFLATTNRFGALDSAVLRRFDLKVSFDYLDLAQFKSLLEACVDDPKNLSSIPNSVLAEFDSLTPGLVRTGVRRLQMMGLRPKLDRLLDVLADEQKMQAGGLHQNPIGFM